MATERLSMRQIREILRQKWVLGRPHDELSRLLAATDTLTEPRCPVRALTVRTLLLLLYGTGMRIGEALALTIHDVDMADARVTGRATCQARNSTGGLEWKAPREPWPLALWCDR